MKNEVKMLIGENAEAREYIAQLEYSLNSLKSQKEHVTTEKLFFFP